MNARAVLARTFESWETAILRPVITSLSTIGIVFLVALLNTQFRQFVFPPETVRDYPLICRAEPYLTTSGALAIDLFIINRSDKGYSREELARFLPAPRADRSRSPTPTLTLTYRREVGKVDAIEVEPEFNQGKGELHTSLAANGRDVRIDVARIAARAVMKVVLLTSGLEDRPANRMTPVAVPFDFQPYQDACYGRG